MKQKFKKLSRIAIILLGISLCLTNCQKDDDLFIVDTKAQNKQTFSRLLSVAKTKKQEYNNKVKPIKVQNGQQYLAREFDSTFETKYGVPEFDKSMGLVKEDGTPILVTPLLDQNNNVTKLLLGFIENGEEKYKVIDESEKVGTTIYVNRETQESSTCPQTRIGARQLGGLFETASRGVGESLTCPEILLILISGLADGCHDVDVDGDTCTGVISTIDCPDEIAEADGPSGGSGTTGTTGTTGGTIGTTGTTGTTDTTGTTGSTGNDEADSPVNSDPPICGIDPFVDLVEVNVDIDSEFLLNFPCHANVVLEVMGLCTGLNTRFLAAFETSEAFHVKYKAEDFSDFPLWYPTNPDQTLGHTLTNEIACTMDCTYTISLNQLNFNAMSELMLGATIIHENTHALLKYLLATNQISTTDSDPTYTDLAIAYCIFTANLENGNYSPDELYAAAHATMVNLIDDMTSALIDYANSKEIVITESYAKRIMQGGTLTASQSFVQSNEPTDTDLYNEIAAIINAERTGQTYTVLNSNDVTTIYEQQGFPLNMSNPCD